LEQAFANLWQSEFRMLDIQYRESRGKAARTGSSGLDCEHHVKMPKAVHYSEFVYEPIERPAFAMAIRIAGVAAGRVMHRRAPLYIVGPA
jgi:hypothetical protein